MSRLNQILIGLFATQLVLLAMTRAFSGGRTEQTTVDFFPGLDKDKVTKLEILGALPQKDDDPPQNKVVIAKVDGKWGIENADNYPVDTTKVDELVGSLAKLRTRNRVLDSSVYHDKLEVAPDKYQRKLTVTSGGESTVLYVGSSPRFKNVHVRLDGEDPVYLVNDFGTTQLGDRAWNWVDREYLNVPEDQVWQVKVKNSKGEVQLDRDPTSKEWAVLGLNQPLDQTVVNDFVRKARSVNLEAPVGKKVEASYGLGASATMVTLTTGTSTVAGLPPPTTESMTWQIGSKIDAADQYYVKSAKSPYVVKVSGFGLKPLIEKATPDFAKKEEEPKK